MRMMKIFMRIYMRIMRSPYEDDEVLNDDNINQDLHGDDDDTLPEFDFVPPHSVLVVAGEAIDN